MVGSEAWCRVWEGEVGCEEEVRVSGCCCSGRDDGGEGEGG